jgi:hypothetical protein
MLRLRGHQKILFPERNPNLNLNLDQVGDPHEEDRDARPV